MRKLSLILCAGLLVCSASSCRHRPPRSVDPDVRYGGLSVGRVRASVLQSEYLRRGRPVCFDHPSARILSGGDALERLAKARYLEGLQKGLDASRRILARGGVAIMILDEDGRDSNRLLIPWPEQLRRSRRATTLFIDVNVPVSGDVACYLKQNDVGRVEESDACSCEEGFSICCGPGSCPGSRCGGCLIVRPLFEEVCPERRPFLDTTPFDRLPPGTRF